MGLCSSVDGGERRGASDEGREMHVLSTLGEATAASSEPVRIGLCLVDAPKAG